MVTRLTDASIVGMAGVSVRSFLFTSLFASYAATEHPETENNFEQFF